MYWCFKRGVSANPVARIPCGPFAAILVASIGMAQVGCVSDNGAAAPPGNSGQPRNDPTVMPVAPEVEAACRTYGNATCAKLMACAPADLLADYGDLATCNARRALACTAGASAPGSAVSATLLMACAAELPSGACEAFLTRGIGSCFLRGGRADGDGCASDFQCGSAFCKRTRGINCGTCTPLGRANSPCADSTECSTGLECSGQGFCLPPSAVGGPCSAAQPCKLGAYCAANGVCGAQLEMAGAACQGRDSCSGQRGLICSQDRCAAVPFSKPGQACGGAGVIVCEASGDCILGPQGNMGVCSMVASDGESCAGKSCLSPAECISGICEIPRATDTGFCN